MQVRNIPISDIAPSPLNPRKTFEVDELVELANSIKENGLIQPITVRKTPKGSESKYEIVCGERRYRACLMNEMETIEAVVKELDDKQAFLCMVLENLQRRDVDPLEEAAAINHLYKTGNYKVAQIAKAIGKSQSFVVSRILLNNISDQFAALMREKTLGLVHLQEIAKLTTEQQGILYSTCFTPECIERWPQKPLRMETLVSLINEHVMNTLDTARFSTADGTYSTCGACEGCKFNTATHPKRFGDANTPRCMKRENFLAKNLEALARRAKACGLPAIYIGTEDDNADILKACSAQGVDPTPLGNREYVQYPKEPQEDAYADKEYYNKRLANYKVKKAAFEDNLKDGTVIAVYELGYAGTPSGEVRYVFNTPTDKEGNATPTSTYRVKSMDALKRSLYETEDKEASDVTESRRTLLAESRYSEESSDLSENETGILLSVLLKRLPHKFKVSLGLDLKTMLDSKKVQGIAIANKNLILREFIKAMLSEESVCYSEDLAKLLTSLVEEKMPEENNEATEKIRQEYEKKRDGIRANIEALRVEALQEEPKAETTAE